MPFEVDGPGAFIFLTDPFPLSTTLNLLDCISLDLDLPEY